MRLGSLDQERRLLPESVEDLIRGWLKRAFGALLMLAAGLGWLALLTWSAADPSLSHTTSTAARNVLGPLGAIASDLLLQSLGLAAIFVFLAPAMWGVELVVSERVEGIKLKALLLPVAVLLLAGAAAVLPAPARWPLHHGLGGILGDLILQLINTFVGAGGRLKNFISGAILAVTGLVALLASIGLTWRDFADLLLGFLPHGRARGLVARLVPGLGTGPARRPGGPAAAAGLAGTTPHLDMPAHGAHGLAASDPAEATANALPGTLPPRGFEAALPHADTAFDRDTDAGSPVLAARFAPRRAGAAAPSLAAAPTVPAPTQQGDAGEAPGALPLLLQGFKATKPAEAVYRRPSINLLKRPTATRPGPEHTQTVLRGNARLLEDVLSDFGVKGEVKDVHPGPVVTLFELEPARGTKAQRVISLADDIARSMSAASARVAVIPGKSTLGIELPNLKREMVSLRALLESDAFRSSAVTLPLVLGKSIAGDPVIADLARMPHLLVAGTTGSGKSVGINAMILSLLFSRGPEECRFLMIDPKMLELSVYNGIPHLLTPVVTEPEKAVLALDWVVAEMEERYKRMSKLGVRNIDVFNNRVRNAKKRGEVLGRTVQTGFDRVTGQAVYEQEQYELEVMPYIVVVIDELADLMIVAGKEIEAAVQRLAQMARAAGIHLIMATQRPSVDVITGTIKANFPTRISFRVASKIDSRTILNEQGAEQLLGAGDMLFSAGGGVVQRVHGPFVSDEEVEAVAEHLRGLGEPQYIPGITEPRGGNGEDAPAASGSPSDDLYEKAVAIVLRDKKASTSYIQRRLSIGYNRAADLIERMETDGIISAADAVGRREILVGRG